MKKNILIVSAQPGLAQELRVRSVVRGLDWEIGHARSVPEALVWLRQNNCDAVVADQGLGPLAGVKFLDEVQWRLPRVPRFLLSNLEQPREAISGVGTTHQVLPNPCPVHTAEFALSRAFDLAIWLPSDTATRLMFSLRNIPSPPGTYFRIVKELQSPDASMDSVASIVSEDVAVSAKLLQLANSSMLGLQIQVSSVGEAVLYLGLETTKSLVLLAHTFSHFDGLACPGLSVETLWKHSSEVGRAAQRLMEMENETQEVVGQAFTAGLLHDFGKLLLAANQPVKFKESLSLARDRGIPLWDAERTVFGTDHAEIGGCLLGIWGLPTPILEAVALHHQPVQPRENASPLLAAVHAGNVFASRECPAAQGPALASLDMPYLAAVGLQSRITEWESFFLGERTVRAA